MRRVKHSTQDVRPPPIAKRKQQASLTQRCSQTAHLLHEAAELGAGYPLLLVLVPTPSAPGTTTTPAKQSEGFYRNFRVQRSRPEHAPLISYSTPAAVASTVTATSTVSTAAAITSTAEATCKATAISHVARERTRTTSSPL